MCVFRENPRFPQVIELFQNPLRLLPKQRIATLATKGQSLIISQFSWKKTCQETMPIGVSGNVAQTSVVAFSSSS